MDSLTQAVVGAVVGELILGKKIGWRGAAWGVFFGTLPDLDVIVLPFLDPATGIRWHRGISHSILVMILASFLLAKFLASFYKRENVTPREMGWMVFWAWSTHVLVDCFTTYGTQIFEPFSNYRAEMNVLFIVDPMFTMPLLLGMILALRIDPENWRKRCKIVWCSVAVSCIYLCFAFTMKMIVIQKITNDIRSDIPDGKLVVAAPTAFNTILWRAVIETPDGYYLRYWSPFDKTESNYEYFPKHRELASEYEGEDELEALKWFSRGYWVARKGADGKVVIIDMRFPEIRDPDNGQSQPIFQWHLSRDERGEVLAPMLRPKGLNYPASFFLVWERMCGNQNEWDKLREF